jgi:hypothetical protein
MKRELFSARFARFTMPNPSNRSTLESDLAGRVASLQADWLRRFGAGVIPPDFWSRARYELNQELAAGIVIVYLLAGRALAGGLGSSVGDEVMTARAASFAGIEANGLAGRYIDNSLAMAQAGKLPAEIFTAERAASLGVTETTRAITAGERDVIDFIRAGGRVLSGTWRTERDASVCPICRPLDGQPEDVWSREVPGGPPAHPNCRCDLTWSESP